MERVRFQEQRIMGWLKYLTEKYLRRNSKAGIKEMKDVQLHFPLTDFEMEKRVKNIFGPMYLQGAMSWRTYLKMANLRRENEEQYKREEKKMRDEGLLDPPTTFAQKVVGQEGQPIKEVQSQMSPGSPDEAGEQLNAITKPVKV